VVQLLTERLDMLSMGQRRLLTAAKGDLLKLTRSQDQAAYLRQLIDKLLRAQQEYSDHHRALLEHHFGKAVADAAMADWENLGRSWIWLTDSLEEGILGSSAWAVPDHWDRALRQPWPTPSAAEELPTLLVAGALVVTLLGVLAAAARLLGRSGGRSGGGDRAAAAAYECGFAPYAALSSSSLLLFYRLAVFFVVFEAELIFLFPWAASLTATAEAGNPGPFLAPLGFIGLLFYGYGRELRANALKL
jgi:NADH-quinone oxidoreductase subunit A